jgi:hypothetical protein
MTTAAARGRLRLGTRHLPVLVLACVFVIAAIVIMHAGRDTTFFYDDWNFVTQRLGWRPHILLYPHNEHLSLLPVLVYKLLFETVGLDHYGVYRFVAVLFNLACGTLIFFYVRRRLGDWIAVGLALVLVLMGASAYDIIWPFQIGFLGSMAAGLAALLCLDRRTFRGDVLACFFTAVSLSSSSQGLFFLLAIAIDWAFHDERLRRIWVPGIPAVLYGLWYLKYGVGHLTWGKAPQIPDQIYGGLSAGSAAATGMPDSFGPTLALIVIAALLFALPRAGVRLPRLIIVAAMPVAFFALTVLARGLPPTEARYIYPTAIFVVLLASESFAPYAPTGVLAICIAVLLAMGALGRAPALNALGDQLRVQAANARSGLAAGEIMIDHLDPLVAPDPEQPQLHIGWYDRAVKQYGSSATWTPQQIPSRSPAERGAVDAALIRLIGPFAGPPPAKAPANCTSNPGDNQRQEIKLPAGRLYVKAGTQPVAVVLRRFGDAFTDTPQVEVKAGSAATIGLPKDRATQQWTAGVSSTAPFSACPF